MVFQVVNFGKNGHRLDISSKVKSPDGKIVNFKSRKNEGQLLGYEVSQIGDFEICFNNK